MNGKEFQSRNRFYHRVGLYNIIARPKLGLAFFFPIAGDDAHPEGQPLFHPGLPEPRQIAEAVYHAAEHIQLLRLPDIFINIITAEKFVAAVTRQSNRYMVARQFGYKHRRNLGTVRKRFIIIIRNTVHQFEHFFFVDIKLRMVRSKIFCYRLRIPCFVIFCFVKTDGKSFDRRIGMRLRDCRHQRRIISAA